MATAIPSLTLPNGAHIPTLGQGTWRLGERRERRGSEIAALQVGLDLGLTLIDTAEMYGEGATEELVGEAIAGRRAGVYLVSKVYPHNATARGTAAACARSLKRLRTDYLDLYLLHWRGSTPLSETVEALERLRAAGQIRAWGVSNFDTADMQELFALGAVARQCQTNQVLYNLTRRGPEWDLLPWQSARTPAIPLMAYSPIEQARGSLLRHTTLAAIAARHGNGLTAAQIALAWVLARPNVLAIPKSGRAEHVRANAAAATLTLTAEDLADLDAAFPPPAEARPLEML